MKKIIGIYIITSPSGSIYIGQSVNITERWGVYLGLRCKSQTKLYESFLEHGVENHTFEIIDTLEVDDEHELDWLEIYFIKHFDCFDTPNGLNLTEGGSNGRRSDESRKRMSTSALGKNRSKEHCDNISKAKKGKKQRPETVIKRIESKKRNKEEKIANGTYVEPVVSEETRNKKRGENNPMFGKKQNAETKAKKTEAFNNKTQEEKDIIISKNIETRKRNKEEKIKNGTYVKKIISKEQKEHLSKINTGKTLSPETIAKRESTRKKNREKKLANGDVPKKRVDSKETVAKREETKRRNKEEKIANGTYVKITRSEKTLKKLSESHLGKKLKPESIIKREATKKIKREEKLMRIKSKNMRINNHVNRRNRKIIRQEKLTMIF